MKRKNLIIDEELLHQAQRALGTSTESETVNMSLREVLRMLQIRELSQYFGSGAWTGNLSDMREDKPNPKRGK